MRCCLPDEWRKAAIQRSKPFNRDGSPTLQLGRNVEFFANHAAKLFAKGHGLSSRRLVSEPALSTYPAGALKRFF